MRDPEITRLLQRSAELREKSAAVIARMNLLHVERGQLINELSRIVASMPAPERTVR